MQYVIKIWILSLYESFDLFSPNLYHVVKRLFISKSEALSNVQHVDFRARNHDPDQRVISCTQTLKVWQTSILSK